MATKDRIFLAHASEDKPQVRKLYQHLMEQGFSPWLDVFDLVPGQNWREEIPKAIEDAAVCLACLSKRSVAKESYVQREFRYGLSAYAERPPGSIYLIPIRLDNCNIPDIRLPKMELNLRDLHWVDLFEVGGFERLVGAIERNVKPTRPALSRKLSSEPKTVAPQLQKAKPSSSLSIEPFRVFKDIDATWCPEMVLIPEGTFLMGSPTSEVERLAREGPQHKVTLSEPFLLGRYAVTFEEYDHFCEGTCRVKPDDEGWGRGRRPVINVSWEDANAYCVWLGEVTGRRYHLPNEAQWEYACRAGTETPFSFGANVTPEQANFDGSYPYAGTAIGEDRRKTVPVGSLPGNPWGLYEMHGNVWEWCADWLEDYPSKAVTDPQGPAKGTDRVVRGGSWSAFARGVRSAFRSWNEPGFRLDFLGFRCAGVREDS